MLFSKKNPSVFVISISINYYKAPLYQIKNAVNDAKQLVEKVKADAVNSQIKSVNIDANQTRTLAGSALPITRTNTIDSVYTYLLLDQNATLKNIEAAFKEVASTATTNDILIFYFGGISIEDKINNTTFHSIYEPGRHLQHSSSKLFYRPKQFKAK